MANSESRFRGDIQGLRAIAAGAVLIYHAGVPFATGGYVGVDIFFVISGFLITSLLLRELESSGKVSFGQFYARRVRRILPASFVVLALSVVAAMIWYPPLLIPGMRRDAVATALYVPNYLFANDGTLYLADKTPSLFQHYWSLGVEEQFYLAWPLLLFLGYKLFRHVQGKRLLGGALAVIVAASFVSSLWYTQASQPWAFFSLPTRAWELGIGGLSAFLLTYRPKPLTGTRAAVVGWIGVAGLAVSIFLFGAETTFPGFAATVPVVSTALVIIAGDAAAPRSPTAMLSTRPMLWLGLISYSLYLVHWPILRIPQMAAGLDNPLPTWGTLLLGATSVPAAYLMYRFVENPMRHASFLTRAKARRSLLCALAGSLAACLLANAAFTYSASKSLYSNREAPLTVLQSPPQFTDYVPRNLQPDLREAQDDTALPFQDGCHLDFTTTEPADCVYGDPAAPRLVLFGDSHAAHWFPAVLNYAQTHGYALELHTKSSCPSAEVEVLRDGLPYDECDQWRDAVVEQVNAEHPAAVILSNYDSIAVDVGNDGYASTWGDALRTTVENLDVPSILIADTPDLGTGPSICLSVHLEDATTCSLPPEQALRASTRRAEQQLSTDLGVPYIDLTDLMCSDDLCAPIIGNTLLYLDSDHMTATFSAQLSAPLAKELDAALGTVEQ